MNCLTINYEPITTQRLDDFGAIMREYEVLKDQKYKLEKRLGLSGVDYSKIKVTSGNGQKLSEQERFTIALQRINAKIADYESWLIPEKEKIKTQIARIRYCQNALYYRRLLVLRYIEHWKWAEIIQEFFELEYDYEAEKNLKYRDTVMYWNRRALEELAKISAQPYVPAAKQLTIALKGQGLL